MIAELQNLAGKKLLEARSLAAENIAIWGKAVQAADEVARRLGREPNLPQELRISVAAAAERVKSQDYLTALGSAKRAATSRTTVLDAVKALLRDIETDATHQIEATQSDLRHKLELCAGGGDGRTLENVGLVTGLPGCVVLWIGVYKLQAIYGEPWPIIDAHFRFWLFGIPFLLWYLAVPFVAYAIFAWIAPQIVLSIRSATERDRAQRVAIKRIAELNAELERVRLGTEVLGAELRRAPAPAAKDRQSLITGRR